MKDKVVIKESKGIKINESILKNKILSLTFNYMDPIDLIEKIDGRMNFLNRIKIQELKYSTLKIKA